MKTRFYKENTGFTLTEILVVTFILVITGSLIAGVVTGVLRGTNKSNTANTVGQSGNRVMTTVGDVITSGSQVVQDPLSPDCTATPVALADIEIQTSSGSVSRFTCDATNDTITYTAGTQTINLTDVTQVRINASSRSTCYFRCTQPDPFTAPIVEVGFTLTQRNPGVFEQGSQSQFRSSFLLRNFVPN